jgi:glycerophosphoryl diester phosphodiesterase
MDKPQLPVSVPAGFRIIAHRGASGYAPENTLAAFSLAQKMGVSEIEFDLQFSRDRQIMVCRDRVLDRYGYPGRKVANLTYVALSDLDMGSWFSPFHFRGEPMVRFEDLLSEFSGAFTYHAEIKEPAPGLTEAILALIAKHKLESRTIVTSFHFEAVLEAKEIAPALPVGWLVSAGDFHAENIAKNQSGWVRSIMPTGERTHRRTRGRGP